MIRSYQWMLFCLIALVLAFYPYIFGPYYTNVLVNFGIFALYGVSFNLLLGYTGLLSLGHAMYFGTGGYTAALALTHIEGCPLLFALLLGFIASIAVALILCPIVARVGGAAFSMLHLAFGMLMHILALKLRSITGGEDGIGGFPIPSLSIPGIVSIDMTDPVNFFYFAVIVIGGSLWLTWFFTKTPFGQIVISVRDNAKRVDYMGFKVTQSKAVVYTFAAGFAGIAGAVYAMFQDLISADGALGIQNSFQAILITMVGGTGSFFGPLWGSAIFTFIEEMTIRYFEHVELVMGLLLITVIMFFPKGFSGGLQALKNKWWTRRQGTQRRRISNEYP